MDQTINALGQLLVQALPTFFIVLLLYVYLRQVFFQPLGRILAERDEATEGARRKAAAALDHAHARAAAYEDQIRAARNEIYREQEEQRRLWREEQSGQVAGARRDAHEQVAQARASLAAEAEAAKAGLAAETQSLADRISRTILQGRAA